MKWVFCVFFLFQLSKFSLFLWLSAVQLWYVHVWLFLCFPAWGLLSFLNLQIFFPPSNLESFPPWFLQIVFNSCLFSPVSPISCMCMYLMFSHRSMRVFWFVFNLFLSGIRVYKFYWHIMKFTDSSAISNLPLSHLVNF